MKRILQYAALFRCPICQSPMLAEETSLRCKKGHDFSLSKKGYVDFCPSARSGLYDSSLFDSRNRFISGGFYADLTRSMSALLNNRAPAGLIVDAGCGEGSFLKTLVPDPSEYPAIGLDLSRPGIQRAARGGGGWIWAVGNLGRIPIVTNSTGAILNILSPANYPEFKRILIPDGIILKVVPGEKYLHEVRALAKERLRHGKYSNENVVQLFKKHFSLIESREICSTYPLTPSQAADLIAMTPMTQSIKKEQLDLSALTSVTIHLIILAGHAR